MISRLKSYRHPFVEDTDWEKTQAFSQAQQGQERDDPGVWAQELSPCQLFKASSAGGGPNQSCHPTRFLGTVRWGCPNPLKERRNAIISSGAGLITCSEQKPKQPASKLWEDRALREMPARISTFFLKELCFQWPPDSPSDQTPEHLAHSWHPLTNLPLVEQCQHYVALPILNFSKMMVKNGKSWCHPRSATPSLICLATASHPQARAGTRRQEMDSENRLHRPATPAPGQRA